jgi:hypothetical protein
VHRPVCLLSSHFGLWSSLTHLHQIGASARGVKQKNDPHNGSPQLVGGKLIKMD